MNKEELRFWIRWILEELLPDYYEQVDLAKVGTGVSLAELHELEEYLRKLLEEL